MTFCDHYYEKISESLIKYGPSNNFLKGIFKKESIIFVFNKSKKEINVRTKRKHYNDRL